ncbi:MAG: hypothetical protein C4334_14155 [Pyrinomonas sp.]|uniref:DUF58 domain-containing protein n=1 Tax=Pyrinomonas sp. TaxID=2080306 RepID=UPI00331CA389
MNRLIEKERSRLGAAGFWPKTRRDWLQAVASGALVLGGVFMAVLTALARRWGEPEMARLAAIASLIFVALIIIFVIPPLFRSARAEIALFDLPVRIGAGGWLFLALLAVVTLAAANTGNNLLFLIFSTLVSTLFVALAAGRMALRELQVQARFPDHLFAGESAPALVAVQNSKRVWPSISILVEARAVFDGKMHNRALGYFVYVPARSRVEQRIEHRFDRRGRWKVIGFDLSTRFPFGFFRLRRRLHARDVEIIIYPKPEPIGDELHLLPMALGQSETARRGTGHDLYSLRDYQPHDSLRHVDWKATARARRLIVREFTAEEERRVHVLFDTMRHEEGNDWSQRFERGVILAASLVAHFVAERMEVRLSLGEETGEYGRGRDHMYACLRRLALVQTPERVLTAVASARFWEVLVPPEKDDEEYLILLTSAPHGSIPTYVWRRSHVIHI